MEEEKVSNFFIIADGVHMRRARLERYEMA
jgi:hypothetical protein